MLQASIGHWRTIETQVTEIPQSCQSLVKSSSTICWAIGGGPSARRLKAWQNQEF